MYQGFYMATDDSQLESLFQIRSINAWSRPLALGQGVASAALRRPLYEKARHGGDNMTGKLFNSLYLVLITHM